MSEASVTARSNGEGLSVTLTVPSYDGDIEFEMHAERDADGDWRVFVPWFEDLRGNPAADQELILENGVGVTNGICYIGAPDQ
jgi:hypothetical protein